MPSSVAATSRAPGMIVVVRSASRSMSPMISYARVRRTSSHESTSPRISAVAQPTRRRISVKSSAALTHSVPSMSKTTPLMVRFSLKWNVPIVDRAFALCVDARASRARVVNTLSARLKSRDTRRSRNRFANMREARTDGGGARGARDEFSFHFGSTSTLNTNVVVEATR